MLIKCPNRRKNCPGVALIGITCMVKAGVYIYINPGLLFYWKGKWDFEE